MPQSADGEHLTLESRRRFRIQSPARSQQLQRNRSTEPHVRGSIHRPHAAFAQHVVEAIIAKNRR
jgi:hypothetical protein